MTVFAELVAATNFSFLRGASHPSDMLAQAIALGQAGIGIADRNSVAGVVRAHVALHDARARARAKFGTDLDFKLAVGARLVFADDTPDIVAYPATRLGWGRLTRLLTLGNRRAKKGGCVLRFADLAEHCQDLLLIVLPGTGADLTCADLPDLLARLAPIAPARVWLGINMPRGGRDGRRLARLTGIADVARVPVLATCDALYAAREDRPLHDVMTCIRKGVTVQLAGRLLAANAERHLKSPTEMARLFRDAPHAVDETVGFLARVDFSLDQLRYEYPHEPVPEGWMPQDWLEHLVLAAARDRFPAGLPPKLVRLLDEEFALIRERQYAYYFLTVHDVVAFARAQVPPILCQGRGSAANSAVCFLLGITSVDPMQHDLLFSRFVSSERDEPPDIDVDFEHERREEVMQYVYRRYGRERAGIAATVIHYRPRSAVRQVGKALGLSEDITTRITSTVWGSFSDKIEERRFAETGFSLDNPAIGRLKSFVDQILQFPRHLSQHVGGFVLTEGRLDELVPIHNGGMADRTFIEWDKDDIDALGLMKVDVLALGMLTCIRKAFELMRRHGLGDHTLGSVPQEDPATYAMLQKGDSIGVFQLESRAQINMLPRLKPETFYDLVIQVAIVRPGPIQGDMVHPYLRRRKGDEEVVYPSPHPAHGPANELEVLLGKTKGVPLFQEQAMKLAIVAAKFTPDEANRLRKAMATFRHVGGMQDFERKMIGGMTARGYEEAFARRCFEQIRGFGSYGFPESHALSFAILVYVSSWLKCHHAGVFACALLNAQPRGFYAPAQIVRDARQHGVEVRAIDINASEWDSSLEALDSGHAIRLGFRQIGGFQRDWAERIAAARPFASIEALARSAALPSRALRLLADADACRSIGQDRREALWDVRRTPADTLPLFAAADARELGLEPDPELPAMPLVEHVTTDYQMTRLSLKAHPMLFLRDGFAAEGILSAVQAEAARHDARVRVAGIVLVRQRPGKGNAIFITLEDETGITNVLIWARLFERYRRAIMASRLMLVEGVVQRSPQGVVHLMVSRVVDRTADLDSLSDGGISITTTPLSGSTNQHVQQNTHPRDVRILPRSRDFH